MLISDSYHNTDDEQSHDNIQNELTNVDSKTVTRDDFQNQLPSFSRVQEKDNLFSAKGSYLAGLLKNLPEDLIKEAEEKISHIVYKSELRMKKIQVILMFRT